MKKLYKNATGKDLSLVIDGAVVSLVKDQMIEGEQYERFVGAGGLVIVGNPSLNEPVLKKDILDLPKVTENVLVEPVKNENVLDAPIKEENLIQENTPRRRGRPSKAVTN